MYPLKITKRNKREIYNSNQLLEFSFLDVMVDMIFVFFKVWQIIVRTLVHFILPKVRCGNTTLLTQNIFFTQKIH